jgi:hypothetical protein
VHIRAAGSDRRSHKVLEIIAKRARGARHGHLDARPRAVDLNAIHQPEVDDVDAELRVEDGAKGFADGGFSQTAIISGLACQAPSYARFSFLPTFSSDLPAASICRPVVCAAFFATTALLSMALFALSTALSIRPI